MSDDSGSFLGLSLGLVSLGLMFGVEHLDTLLIDFSALENPAIRFVQLGFFALSLYFFTEV